jgi:hypothetical protein
VGNQLKRRVIKLIKINAFRREVVGRLTGLPQWTDGGEKGGYLPLILPFASEVGFFPGIELGHKVS